MKNTFLQLSVLCFATFPIAGAHAALTPLPATFDASTGFDVQSKNDAWGANGPFADCGAAPSVANTYWTSGESIHSGTNYYTARQAYVFPAASTIPGNDTELFVLGGPGWIEMRKNLTCNRRFVALPGALVRYMSCGTETWFPDGSKFVTATLEVRSGVASPLTFSARCNGPSYRSGFHIVANSLVGDGTAAILTPYAASGINNSATADAVWWFKGDASEYFGKWTVDGTRVNPGSLSLALDTADFAGTVVLTNDARLAKFGASSPRVCAVDVSSDSAVEQDGVAFTFGDMAFAEGGRVLYKTTVPGLVTVTNGFVHDGPVVLDFNNQDPFGWTVQKSIDKAATSTNELFRFAPGIDVSENDFALANVAPSLSGFLPVPVLAVRENQDGTKSLLLTHRPVVVALRDVEMSTASSEIAGWSDDYVSHPDADYLMTWLPAAQSRTGANIQTKLYVQARNDAVNDFGGGALVIDNANVWIYGTRANFRDLVLRRGTIFASNVGGVTIDGLLRVAATDANNLVGNIEVQNGTLSLRSGIVGDATGVLNLKGPNGVALSGDNSAFAGRIAVNGSASSVTVANGSSLGGGNATLVFNAIDLNKAGVVLAATNDAAFADSNRGFLVRKAATIDVAEGRTMSAAAPFTFASALTKTGSGVLAFGAKPRFIDGDAGTEPLAGTNVLDVAAGGIRVDCAEALNGLAVTFADETELRIPVDTADSDLAAYGAVMTRALSSFAVPSGKIALVAEGFDPDAKKVSFPVATFATRAEANAAAAATKPRKLSSGLSGEFSVEATSKGYTVFATFAQFATVLTVR